MTTIATLSDTPKYSIKAVCAQTGIMAVTLRAWERRYRLLTPHRTNSNYRLYSERDVALLRWLKGRVDSGISISSVVAELKEMHANGKWPETVPALRLAGQVPNPPLHYAGRLFSALMSFDESGAGGVLSEAHSMFDLVTVCMEVITPCLVMIGDAWHQGEILISTEHLASNYLKGRLMALFQSFPSHRDAPHITVACTPNEQHEFGNLMLATLLRRDGYRVDYLGTNVPAADLIDYLRSEMPTLAVFSAGNEQAVAELCELQRSLAGGRPPVTVGYGGRIFVSEPRFRESTSGIFLGETVRDGHARIQRLIAGRNDR